DFGLARGDRLYTSQILTLSPSPPLPRGRVYLSSPWESPFTAQPAPTSARESPFTAQPMRAGLIIFPLGMRIPSPTVPYTAQGITIHSTPRPYTDN
ncbi:hypothetical protein, partial [Limnospira platensis]|uniref:hypothetical protein n=1 Tax=Limnospira platensis TaxID=118562 RepID=UPI00339319BD